MTNPNDPRDADFRATLPAELQELDRELSEIRIEERPSFGPELEQELSRAWASRERKEFPRPRPWVRMLVAASVAGLMITSLSVPSARAAVIGLVRTVAEEVGTIFASESPVEAELPPVQVQVPEINPAAPEGVTEMLLSPVDASEEIEVSDPDLLTIPDIPVTFPEIISREEAAALIRSHYPPELRDAGVEGSVKLLFWVNDEGATENIKIRRVSGNTLLDNSAVTAAREFRFNPATRNGVAVGTWVEMDIRFFALSGEGFIGLDSAGSGR